MSSATTGTVPVVAKTADADAAPAPTASEGAPPANLTARGLLVVAALVGLADWLLYGPPPGIALPIFILALALGALAVNSIRAGKAATVLATGALVAGVLPFAVNPSVLSFLFAVLGITLFAVLLFTNPGPLAADVFAAARGLILSACYRAPLEMRGALVTAAGKRPQSLTATLVVWFMPVTLGAVFAALLVNANPLIAGWVAAIDLKALLDWVGAHVDGWRVMFWLGLAMGMWPVIFAREHKRRARRQAKMAAGEVDAVSGSPLQVVGRAAILRSLIVFNALFAVQTVLDALYLWGGVALPDGMSYAEYAHRGAYPLIVTALLAAAFVIVALRPGSETERSPLIRVLVYAWIAQNVWLVVSSMLRLDLYVAAYSLTYWRIAAFVWMLIVAIGLVLILTRIALRRSSQWLIGANLFSLALVLYVCAYPNFARIIAEYNVIHSAEMGGGGPALDGDYLRSLGAQAIPAADMFLAAKVDDAKHLKRERLDTWRGAEAVLLREAAQDWRAWSYWDWRLRRYVDETPAPAPPVPEATTPAAGH